MSTLRSRFFGFACLSVALIAAPASSHAIEITVLHENPSVMTPVHQEIVRRLKEKRPDIDVRLSSVIDYSEMLQRNLREAITNRLPDVAFHGHNNIAILVDRGVAARLDGFIAAEGNWEAQGFLPAIQDVGRVGGNSYAIPFTLSIPVIYYNMDLVKTAGGVAQGLPAAWPQILDLARTIRAPSGGIFFQYASTGSWTLMALMQSFGADILTKDGKDVAFDSPAGNEAIAVLGEIGKIREGQDMTQAQARQAFAAGALGIIVDTSSRLVAFEEQAKGKFEVRAAPFPLKAGVKAVIPPSGTSAVIMTQDAARQKAAWEYIKVATSPEIQAFMVNKTGFLPANAIAVEHKDLLGLFKPGSNWRAAAERLPNLTTWLSFPGENSVKIHREIADGVQAIVTLKRPPADGLKAIAQTTRSLLPK